MNFLLGPFALAAMLSLLLAGCGGSSSPSSGYDTPSPRVATLYAGGDQSQGIDVFDLAANGALTLRENFNSDQVLVDVRSMALNADRSRLVAGMRSGTGMQMFAVDAETGELTDIDVNRHTGNNSVVSHPEKDIFYVSRSAGLGTLHAVAADNVGDMSEMLMEIDVYDTTNNIHASVIHPSGSYAFISHGDNAPDPSEHWITMLPLDSSGGFDLPTVEEILIQDEVWNPRIRAISPQGDMLIVTSSNGPSQVAFVTVDTLEESMTLLGTGPLQGQYRSAVFHPDGDWAYAATSTGTVTAYEIDRSKSEIRQIGENLNAPPIDYGVGALAMSPDGTTLYSALAGDDVQGVPGKIAIIHIDQNDGSLSFRATVDMNITAPLSLLAVMTRVNDE